MTILQLATPPPRSDAAAKASFARVLLAIDFGSASLAAARWATAHVARAADAVLMHVMAPPGDSPRDDAMNTDKRESLHGMIPALVGGLGGFAATLDVAAHRSVVRVGPPSRCLAAIANDTDADLLVLGRRGDANRIGVGEPNVIERAARRTGASVLVVPEGATSPPERIVAAVDQSPFAPIALRVARWLAQMHEIPLSVLHVLPPALGAYERVIRSAKHLNASRKKTARAPEQRSVRPALPLGSSRWLMRLGRAHDVIGRDSAEVATGDPAREIARSAMEHGPSLVVVGMRGADEAPLGSVGSVARELLTRGPMPVLAVNAP